MSVISTCEIVDPLTSFPPVMLYVTSPKLPESKSVAVTTPTSAPTPAVSDTGKVTGTTRGVRVVLTPWLLQVHTNAQYY